MAYSSGGLIQASDFNTRVGSVNQLWGTGSGDYGYGQSSTVATNSTGAVVPASDWATLIARMSTMQQHQFNNTSGIPSQPTSGSIITYLSQVDTAITSLQNNRLTFYAQGSTSAATTASNSSNWSSTSTKTWTVTFSSGDAARYFFNAGGMIVIASNGNSINESQWNSFINTGFNNFTFYARSSGHNGSVGSLTRNTYLNTSGYYNLTTTPTTWLQLSDTGTGNSAYNSNTVNVNVSSNGTQGSNGDAGSVLTFSLIFTNNDSNTFQLPLTGSTTAALYYYFPESTYLSSTWGTPTISNTVNSQS
jgi:hypothetical protein